MTKPLSPAEVNHILGRGRRVCEGSCEFACPHCHETLLTDDASFSVEIEGGLRFLDVPCKTCGTFYTVEMIEGPDVSG